MQTKCPLISRICTHPLLWILLLVPIAWVGYWLALYWPCADRRFNLSAIFPDDNRSIVVRHIYASSDKSTNRNVQIDFATGLANSFPCDIAVKLKRGSDSQVATSKSRFPLRDIFLLTAVVAVLFSVLRFAPLPKAIVFDLRFTEGLVNCMLMATNAMVVSWCALSGRAIWVRWPIWLGSPLVCATLGVLYSAWLDQSKSYEWIAAYHGVVQITAAVTIFFMLHAYRWRGWRFALQGRAGGLSR